MSDQRTKTGARLSSHHRGFTYRLAQMTDADYKQPKCQVCDVPIHDDRLDYNARFCSKGCAIFADRHPVGCKRVSRSIAKRSRSVYAPVYALAEAACGEWVQVPMPDIVSAKLAVHAFNQRRDFEASYVGAIVSIRLVVAA